MKRLLTAFILLAALTPGAWAQDVSVSITAANEVAHPGNLVRYTLIAANSGATRQQGVTVRIKLPAQIERFYFDTTLGSTPTCPGGYCDPDETITWMVGDLEAGEHRTLIYQTRLSANATNGPALTQIILSATGLSDVLTSHTLTVDDALGLQLGLVANRGPAQAGEALTYTLAYGNVGTSPATAPVLTAQLPAGTTFVEATDGGAESGGTITWMPGALGVGASGQVRFTVLVDGGLTPGHVLQAGAALAPGSGSAPSAQAAHLLAVDRAAPLQLALTANHNAAGRDEPIMLTLTVSNTGGLDLSDVEAEVLLPGGIERFYFDTALGHNPTCPGGYCDPGETIAWAVGDLAPGQSRATSFLTRIADNATQGDVLHAFALARGVGTGTVSAAHTVQVDPSPLLHLSLAPDHAPARPGSPITYTLSYGNVGTTAPTAVVLEAAVPEGTTFAGATEGGVESGGTVRWTLGALGVGASGQVRFTVVPEAALQPGHLLHAHATLDSGRANEVLMHGYAVVAVAEPSPLRVDYTLSHSAGERNQLLLLTLTAANSGSVDLTDVEAEVLLPGGIERFYFDTALGHNPTCPGGYCDPGETIAWAVGDLAPGQSRATSFLTRIADNATQGDIYRSIAEFTSPGTAPERVARDFTVDPTPLLRLSLTPRQNPVAPGSSLTYVLSFGNVGTAAAPQAVIKATLPEGTTFSSATGGGIFAGNEITWTVGSVGTARGGQLAFTVGVPAGAPVGTLLNAEAQIWPGRANEVPVRARATVAVAEVQPLALSYSISTLTPQPGDRIEFTATARNDASVALTNTSAQLLLPGNMVRFYFTDAVGDGLTCPGSYCDPNETVRWNVGELLPGQSRTLRFASTIAANAQEGALVYTSAVGSADGTFEVYDQHGLFIGTPTITSAEMPSEVQPFGISVVPNPAADVARFTLHVPVEGHVTLRVYDVLGRAVHTLADRTLSSGEHLLTLDTRGLPAGLYFYRVSGAERTRSGTLTVVR